MREPEDNRNENGAPLRCLLGLFAVKTCLFDVAQTGTCPAEAPWQRREKSLTTPCATGINSTVNRPQKPVFFSRWGTEAAKRGRL